jgi:hypothetical protein
MDVVSKLPSIAMTLAILYILIIAGYSAYLFINRKDQTVLPPTDAWWWPTTLNQYLHVYPRPYKYMSNVTAPTSFVSNTYSNVSSLETCKTNCEESPDECIGFESNLVSNICVTYSSVGFPIEYTGNNIYIVEGNEPMYMYVTYNGQQANSNILASSNITSSSISTNYIDCSAQCSANGDCQGFEYNNSSTNNNCTMYTTMDSSNLVANTSITSYILQNISMSPSPI